MMVMEGQYWKGLRCQIVYPLTWTSQHYYNWPLPFWNMFFSLLLIFHTWFIFFSFPWLVGIGFRGRIFFFFLTSKYGMSRPSILKLYFSLYLLLSWISSSHSFKYLFKMTPDFMSSLILTSPLNSIYLTTWHFQLEICKGNKARFTPNNLIFYLLISLWTYYFVNVPLVIIISFRPH